MVFVLLLIWIVILLVKNLDKPEVIVSTETSETYGMEKQKTTVAPPQDTPTVVLPDPQAESTEIQEEIVLTEQDNVTSTTTITEVIESNGFTEQNVTTTITEVMDTNGMTNVITETTVAETSTVSDSILCKGEPASSWDTLPHQLSFARNIKLVLKGKVTGQITVKPLKDQQGLITSDVKFAPNELQKEMKYDITQGDLTTLVLDFPQDKGCIDVNLTVGLPKYASRLLLDVQNVDIKLFPLHVTLMDVRNTNGNVVLGNWAGDDLSVVNSNGYIHANQIEAKETVHIENSNGPIQIGKSVEADSKLNILNKNGPIETIDTLSAEDNIRIETSNGVIRSNDLRGESIQVSSTNEAIYLNRLEAETIAIRGSNGPIVASITEAKDSEVRVISNNGRVDLNVVGCFFFIVV
jgi:DUF4097 and DUF4098 domain-containing protein YvlB